MRRILCIVLSFAALLWSAPAAAAEDAVYISTAADLAALSARVAAGDAMAGVTVYLTEDISLKGEHTPIGTDPSHPFSGVFDGGGHRITGLSVKGGGDYSALFGCVTDGTVRSLHLEGEVEGGSYSALLIGRLYAYRGVAAAEDCTLLGAVMGGSYTGGAVGLAVAASFGKNARAALASCTVKAEVAGDMYVGGFFGKAEARSSVAHSRVEIDDCTVYGEVRARGDYGAIGGGLGGALSAQSDGGSATALCKNSLSYAHTSVEKTAAGGVLGTVGALGEGAVATMEGCAALGDTLGGALSGGLCGKCESAEGGIASLKDSVAAGSVYGGSVYSVSAGEGIEDCIRASSAADLPDGADIPQNIKGDVNGDGKAGSLDAALILKADAALGVLGLAALNAADQDGDGRVTSLDAAILLRYDAGLIKALSAA